MANYLIKDNAIYESFENGVFMAWRKMNIEQGEPAPVFTGEPIPFAMWQQVVSWFYKHRSDEVQVRLFYNKATREWRVVPLPQYFPSGLSTKEIDGGDASKIKAEMVSQGFQIFGSIHSHCSIRAFQSGTDHADEVKNAGIHITIGHLDKPELDVHGRVCLISPGKLNDKGEVEHACQQSFHDANLTQWIALPDGVSGLHPKLMRTALEFYLKLPVTEEIFPKEWETRLIPAPKPVYQQSYSMPSYGRNAGGGYYKNGKWTPYQSWEGWDGFGNDSWSPLQDDAEDTARESEDELFHEEIWNVLLNYDVNASDMTAALNGNKKHMEQFSPHDQLVLNNAAKEARAIAIGYRQTESALRKLLHEFAKEEIKDGVQIGGGA